MIENDRAVTLRDFIATGQDQTRRDERGGTARFFSPPSMSPSRHRGVLLPRMRTESTLDRNGMLV